MSEQFLKLLLIGDSGVGKSSILSRFCDNTFTEAFYNTIGVDFKTKKIDDPKCKLQIWDTAGQQRFRTITSNYYKGAHGIIIVFDLSSKESFKNVNFWLTQIENHNQSNVTKILIGNKCDAKRQINEQEGIQFAKKNNLQYLECSAYSAVNIQLVFESIARRIIYDKNEFIKKGISGKQISNDQKQKIKKSNDLNKKSSNTKPNSKCC